MCKKFTFKGISYFIKNQVNIHKQHSMGPKTEHCGTLDLSGDAAEKYEQVDWETFQN